MIETLEIKFTVDDGEQLDITEIRQTGPSPLTKDRFWDVCHQMETALYGNSSKETN